MSNTDLVTIIGNISRSLIPMQSLITGVGYVVGILLVVTAVLKFRETAEGGGHGSHIFIPLVYFIGGAALIFLPSAVGTLSATVFGNGNILQYTPYSPYDIYGAMSVVIRTAGAIWFVRGCVLLVHSSEPGVQEGPKGLTFLFAGILALNFEGTFAMVNYIVDQLLSLTYKSSG